MRDVPVRVLHVRQLFRECLLRPTHLEQLIPGHECLVPPCLVASTVRQVKLDEVHFAPQQGAHDLHILPVAIPNRLTDLKTALWLWRPMHVALQLIVTLNPVLVRHWPPGFLFLARHYPVTFVAIPYAASAASAAS